MFDFRIPYKLVGSFKGALFLGALVLILSVLVYTNMIVSGLRENSKNFVALKVERFKELFLSGDEALDQYLKEITTKDFPLIVANSEHKPTSWSGLPELEEIPQEEASVRAESLMRKWIGQGNEPLPLILEFGDLNLTYYFYYGDSENIQRLRFLPWVELLLVSALILTGYLGFVSIKKSEERFVWVGMARETAHQLGTPLTSMLGWVELLEDPTCDRSELKNIGSEMKRDLNRLQVVAERFHRIGSKSSLKANLLAPVTERAADYIRNRLPQLSAGEVSIDIDCDSDIKAQINPELFGWVIENVLRNGVESLHGNGGTISVSVQRSNGAVNIDIKDNGSGIPRREWRNIFRPGFSTKRHGWGLGLSLAKRIMQDVHRGKIYIAESRRNRGTTMRLVVRGVGG